MLLLLWLLLPGVLCKSHVIPLASLREQASVQAQWLEERKHVVLPRLMEEHNVDMWLMVMQEYAEDTVWTSFADPTRFAARRRTAFVCYHDQDGAFRADTIVDIRPSLWDTLKDIIASSNPSRIALNSDSHIAFSDGLHSGQSALVHEELADVFEGREIVHVTELAVDYIAERVDGMTSPYRDLMETAHAIIEKGLSRDTIVPGETTTADVQWWFRDQVQALGATTWFMPTVATQGKDDSGWRDGVIQQGDLVFCDFGITAYRLNTDTQHMAYVLKDGESVPPAGLLTGLRTSNRMQDLNLQMMVLNHTGNEILRDTLDAMEAEHIQGTIYCHPIGDHGHGAGPLFGLWDMQDGVPYSGELRLKANTWFSIELAADVFVPEWDRVVQFRQEEEAGVDAQGNRYWVYKRQEALHIVETNRKWPVAIALGIIGGALAVGAGIAAVVFYRKRGAPPASEEETSLVNLK